MNRKFKLSVVLIIALLIPTAAAGAYYATVSGELRNSDNNALWEWGANVEVFNCNTLATINTATVPISTSTFSIDVSSVSVATPLCIEVDFLPGPLGDPGNAAKGPYPDRSSNSGNLNTGVYFTGTGPNAVVVSDLTAAPSTQNDNVWLLVPVAAIALIGVWVWQRRRPHVR
jgi:hypothetical protein